VELRRALSAGLLEVNVLIVKGILKLSRRFLYVVDVLRFSDY